MHAILGINYWLWWIGCIAATFVSIIAHEQCGLRYLYHDDGSPVLRGPLGVLYWLTSKAAVFGWAVLLLATVKNIWRHI
jgi:hypothetical protein